MNWNMNNQTSLQNAYALQTPHIASDERLKTPSMNGRVQVNPNEQFHPYQFAETQEKAIKPAGHLANMQESTLLSTTFFLNENIQILQNALRRRVFQQTNMHIAEQNVEQLQIVMRSIYLQYSNNRTDSASIIREQIQDLNEKVLDYCTRSVITNLRQYEQYRKDISSLPVPMDYGLSTSQAGTRSLLQGPLI